MPPPSPHSPLRRRFSSSAPTRRSRPFRMSSTPIAPIPKSVIFGGGSAGGSDHIVIGQMLKAANLNPADMNYVGYAGGGEATAGILSGDVKVGVSGVSEFEGQVESGEMRLLAVSSKDEVDVAGKAGPHTDQQPDWTSTSSNWRAIFAPPDLSDADVEGITAFIDRSTAASNGRRCSSSADGRTTTAPATTLPSSSPTRSRRRRPPSMNSACEHRRGSRDTSSETRDRRTSRTRLR